MPMRLSGFLHSGLSNRTSLQLLRPLLLHHKQHLTGWEICSMRYEEGLHDTGHLQRVYFHQFGHKCQFKINSQLPSWIKTCNHVKSDGMLGFLSTV
ncbi:unnamed protein product, partial [Bubo scandiacus]